MSSAELDDGKAKKLLESAIDFLEYVKNYVRSLAQSRTPPINYIKYIKSQESNDQIEDKKIKLISFGGIGSRQCN